MFDFVLVISVDTECPWLELNAGVIADNRMTHFLLEAEQIAVDISDNSDGSEAVESLTGFAIDWEVAEMSALDQVRKVGW